MWCEKTSMGKPGRLAARIVVLLLAAACGTAYAIDINLTRSLQVAPGGLGLGGPTKLVDMDNDGDLDLLYAYKTRDAAVGTATAAQFTFEWRLNNGTDTWGVAWSAVYTGMDPATNIGAFYGLNGTDQISDIDTGDMDGDGDQDIVACNSLCGIFYIRRENAAGTSWTMPGTSAGDGLRIYNGGGERATLGQSYPNVRRIRVANLDGDGRMDVVAAIAESGNATGAPLSNGILNVYWGGAGATTVASGTDTLNISSLRVGNVAGDAKLDIVATAYDYDNTFVAVHGASARTFSIQTISAPGDENPNDVAIGDLDGDGLQDIVKVTQGIANSSQVIAYRNLGGSWAGAAGTTVDTVAGGNASYVICNDMDTDGDLDLVVAMRGSNQVVYYENPRTATVWPASWTKHYTSITPIDSGPNFLSAGDAQKLATDDAYADLVVGAVGANTISFYKNQTYTYGPSVESVRVATTRTVEITFTKVMDNFGGSASDVRSVLNRFNYSISGAGRNDLLTNPASVTLKPSTTRTYVLTWTAGTILDGLDVTITCDTDMRELDGALPDYVRIHAPLVATDSNRMTISVADAYTYTNAASVTLTATVTGGGAGKQYRWEDAAGVEVQAWNASNQLTLTTFADGDRYRAYVNDGRTENVDSNLATIHAQAPVTVNTLTDFHGKTGDNLSFTVVPAGGYVPSYSYQWQVSHNGGGSWTDLVNGTFNRTYPGSSGASTPVSTVVAGATSATLTITRALASFGANTYDDGMYQCRVRDAQYPTYGPGGQAYTNAATVTLDNVPNVITNPAGANKYVGNSHTLTIVVIGGSGLYNYDYQCNGVHAAGSPMNLPTWTINPLALSHQGTWHVVVSDAYGTDTSADVLLNVRAAMTLSALPALTTIRTGDSVPNPDTLTPDPFVITASGGYGGDVGGHYNYQWQHYVGGVWTNVPNGALIRVLYPGTKQVNVSTTYAGGTSDHFTILRALKNNGATPTPTVLDDGDYRCVVDDGTGSGLTGSSATSGTATLNIEDLVNILTYPVDSAQKYVGESASFNITVIGGHGPYVDFGATGIGYAFIWQANGATVGTGTTNGCTNTVNFTTQASHDGNMVCLVVDYYPAPTTPVQLDTSAHPALLPVKAAVTVSNPGTVHAHGGGTATFTVTASGGYPGYTYKWQYNSGSGWNDILPGLQPSGSTIADPTLDSLTITNVQLSESDYQYHCIATDSVASHPSSSGTSNTGYLTVTEQLTVGATTLVASPSGEAKVYVGEGFTLGLNPGPAGGTAPYHYAWKRNGATFGAPDSNQLVVASATALHDATYTCTISDNSAEPDVTSTGLDVDVYQSPSITQGPQSQTENVGMPVTFTVQTSGGWPPLSYAWWHDPDGAGPNPYVLVTDGGTISGATTDELLIDSLVLSDRGRYKCIVSDDGPTPRTAESSEATLVVTNDLVIGPAGDLKDLNVYNGDTITLHVVVSGGEPGYHYQWYKVGTGPLSAGDTDTLLLSPAQAAFAGDYYVHVSDESGGVNDPIDSRTASVTVHAPLAITGNPSNLIVYAGSPAVFHVTTSGGITPVTYQWEGDLGSGFQPLVEGMFGITGTQSPDLTLAAAPLSANGASVRCVVTASPSDDAASTATLTRTSGTASLQVVPPLTMTPLTGGRTYIDTVADPAFDLALTFSGGLNPSQYEWQRSPAGEDNFAPVPGACCGALSGGNSVVLTVTPSAEAPALYDYRLQITDDVTDSFSNVPQIEFDRHLSIVTQPHNLFAEVNERAELCVYVDGGLGEVSFQWMKDNGSGTFEPIVGGTANCLVLDPVEEEDAGDYACQISDEGSTYTASADSLMTEVVTLTVGGGLPAVGVLGLAALTAVLALAGALLVLLNRRIRV